MSLDEENEKKWNEKKWFCIILKEILTYFVEIYKS